MNKSIFRWFDRHVVNCWHFRPSHLFPAERGTILTHVIKRKSKLSKTVNQTLTFRLTWLENNNNNNNNNAINLRVRTSPYNADSSFQCFAYACHSLSKHSQSGTSRSNSVIGGIEMFVLSSSRTPYPAR